MKDQKTTISFQAAPSSTNPQCKVCMSPDRFEIEVALAERQSQSSVAHRFSRNGQTFNKQNIHSHYRNHMEVIQRAVAEEAATRMRRRMLDVGTAVEVEDQNERNRELMRRQVSAAIENNDLRWSARDAMAFIEQEARLGELRSAAALEAVMADATAFSQAVRTVVPRSEWDEVVAEFDRRVEAHGGPTGAVYRSDELLDDAGHEEA
jgi:hypothetical protein